MSGFQAEVTTTSSSESVTLPFVTGYTYDCYIDWDDGSPLSHVTAWDDPDATHVYATAGSYVPEITGTCPAWSVNNTHSSKLQWTGIVYWGDAVDFDGWQYLLGGWYGCSNLASIGSGSIIVDGLSYLNNCFRSIGTSTSGIELTNDSIFDNCSSVIQSLYVFRSSKFNGTIPYGFLDGLTGLINATRFLDGSTGLTGDIPSLLLAPMTSVTSFQYFFAGCADLRITGEIFCQDGDQGTRFYNKSVNFGNCFDGAGTNISDNVVQELWAFDYGSGTPSHASWINGHSDITLTNWYEIPPDWDGPATKQVINSNAASPASLMTASAQQRNKVSIDVASPASTVVSTERMQNTVDSASILSAASVVYSSTSIRNKASAAVLSPASTVNSTARMRNTVVSESYTSPASEMQAVGKLIQKASAYIHSPASICFGVLNQVHTVNSVSSATIYSPGSLTRGYQNPFLDEQIIPLVETPDGFELVRDKIAEILAKETLLQQSQAQAAGYDPDDWKFSVYEERSRPWEVYRDCVETTPIVNIWYDTDSFDRATSNSEDRQKTTSIYHIDCFAYATSQQTEDGHSPGDESAAKAAHRIGRLVRRILMHPKYESLGFSDDENPVWYRWVTSRLAFQPTSSNGPIQNVMGFRIDLEVQHNEYIELYPEVNLEQIMIQLFHEPDDQVRAELFYREV
jgi:hypothetical protein